MQQLALHVNERKAGSERIASGLDLAIGRVSEWIVSGYWPLRGEPNLRNLERCVWNILVVSHRPSVQLDVVIAPVVGFRDANCRLGHGGGFFDRTLAAMPKRPHVIGIGHAESRIPTIYPQPHDIPMDVPSRMNERRPRAVQTPVTAEPACLPLKTVGSASCRTRR